MNVLCRERKQGEVTGPLERRREHALVSRARAGLPSRLDLATVGDVAAKTAGLFVVDVLDLVDAERADPAPSEPATTTTSTARALISLGTRTLSVALGLAGFFDC